MSELSAQELKKLLDRLVSLRIAIESELESDEADRGKTLKYLRAVKRATRKIEQGREFGACEQCGETIGYGALKMNPAKQICWRCDPEEDELL